MDILDILNNQNTEINTPLAQRRRPKSFDDLIGQEHLLEEGAIFREMIKKDKILSILLYGPPGVGKTAIASLISNKTKSIFVELNATSASVEMIKKEAKKAEENLLYNKKTIVFIDEIHRFNKRQQDVLLPYVETGLFTLIGASTENPYFEVNPALISRLRIINLKPLSDEAISKIIKKAISEDLEIKEAFESVDDKALDMISVYAKGDARKALNLLENASFNLSEKSVLTVDILNKTLAYSPIKYDKKSSEHYNTISAFIKSIRGSDVDAAVHYLAKMLKAGEDPMYIARRLLILASEDIGNADPMALVLANSAKEAVNFLGMPEARITLSQLTCYLALSPKSNSSYLAINKAISDLDRVSDISIPKHLMDNSYKSKLEEDEVYKYPHDYKNAYVEQDYMPKSLENKKYYQASDRGREKLLKSYQNLIESMKGKK